MPKITRNSLRVALVSGAFLALGPAAADARVVEMGELTDEVTPSCPEDCAAIPRTTGFQKRVAGRADTFTVPADGRIVAWTIRLAQPTAKQIAFFRDELDYGEPSAQVTAFRMGTKKPNRGIGRNVGQSGVQELTDYLGQTVQFPMANTLRVKKGDRMALTVPTWAPALAVEQAENTVWRATRPKDDCDDVTAQTAIREVGTKSAFGCAYKAAQLTYSVTLVTKPKPNTPKKPAKGDGKN